MLTNVNGKNTDTKKRLEISKRFLHLRVEDGVRTHDLRNLVNQPLSYIITLGVCIFVCMNKDNN